MFTNNEIQALLLGTQWVTQFGDFPLSQAATNALNKILAVMPTSIKKSLNTFTLRVGPPASDDLVKEDLSLFRKAIAHRNKISIVYKSEKDKKSLRIIWPLTIGYFTNERILVAWCEENKDFRHFKTSRIVSAEILNECYSSSPEKLFQQWQGIQLEKHFTQQR
jgi:predicted DNA-binding transcriptional regulator YafY